MVDLAVRRPSSLYVMDTWLHLLHVRFYLDCLASPGCRDLFAPAKNKVFATSQRTCRRNAQLRPIMSRPLRNLGTPPLE